MAAQIFETQMTADVSNLVQGMNTVKTSLSEVEKAANAIVASFEKLEKFDFSKLGKTTNNIKTNAEAAIPTVSTAAGTIVSPSGSKNRQFKAAQEAVVAAAKQQVELEAALTSHEEALAKRKRAEAEYIKERTKYTAEIVATEAKTAQARADKAAFKNSDENKRLISAVAKKEEILTEGGYYKYKAKHPELFATGGQYHSKAIMGQRALNAVGDAISSSNLIGGKLLGSVMNIAGSFLRSPVAGVAEIFKQLGTSIVRLADDASKAYAQIESVKTQLEVVFSSRTQANDMFRELSEYAVKSPFGVEETSEIAILLRQSGVYASNLLDTLRMIGDTAGGNMEKMKRIANNYAQIVSIGKASMLDMRQFAYAGIPIFEAVSEELGVSQSRLRELISDGQVTSEIIEKVFKNLTGVNGIFENATEKGAKTLKARLQNLADAKQLAMSSIGEWGADIGRNVGNDSILNNLVTGVENIYNLLYKWKSEDNTKRNVKAIDNRDIRIDFLKELVATNKKLGNLEYVKMIEKELNELSSNKYIEADRAVFEERYKSIEEPVAAILNKYLGNQFGDGGRRIETASIDELEAELKNLRARRNEAYRRGGDYMTDSEAKLLDKDVKALKKAIKEINRMDDRLKQAHSEVSVINAQQLAYDTGKSKANESSSMYTSAQELVSIFMNSEEEKKRRDEEHLKVLKTTQEELKKISKYVDKSGTVNLSELTGTQFLDYKSKGFVSPGTKLNVVDSDASFEDKTEQRTALLNQMSWAITEAKKELGGIENGKSAERLDKMLDELKSIKHNDRFFKRFPNLFDDALRYLTTKEKHSRNSKPYSNAIDLLNSGTLSWEVPIDGLNANLDDKNNDKLKLEPIFIPLWKRILGAFTGVTPNVMKSSAGTMDLYKNEVMPRQTAKAVFADILRAGGNVSDVQRFLSSNGTRKQLRGDSGFTYQIDWKDVNKNLKDFALQLRSTTSFINSYKSSLESQYEAYIGIMSEGISASETQDIKSAKLVTAEKFERITKDAGEQFVNAFGEELRNGDGEIVIKIENGIAYGKSGEKLQNQNIVLTGNIFRIIEKELPEIRKEIAKADKTALQSTVLSNSVGKTKSLMYGNAVALSALNNPKTAGIINENKDEINKYLDTRLADILREKNHIPETTAVTDEDVNTAIASGTITVSDITTAIKSALRDVFGNTVFAQNLATAATQESLSQDLAFVSSVNALGPKTDKPKLADGFFNYIFGEDVLKAVGLGYKNLDSINYDAIDSTRGRTRAEAFRLRNTSDLNNPVDTSKLEELGADKDALAVLNDPNATYKERLDVLNEIADTNERITAESLKQSIAEQSIQSAVENFKDSVKSIAKDTATKAFTGTFAAMGESLVTGADAAELMGDNLKEVGASMLKNLGSVMQTTGLQMAGAFALEHNWAGVAGGLAIAAAGGFAEGIGSGLLSGRDNSDDKDDDKTSKLESLADKIADLLEQARIDADYYEKNLRHKTALGINAGYSNKVTSVNDAVITPQGKVISTAPDDYLIATKTPETLGGTGQVNVQPKVNIVVNKNTRANVDVSVTQQIEPDGTVQVVAMIEDIVGQYIGSRRSDDAFAARNAILQGRKSVM